MYSKDTPNEKTGFSFEVFPPKKDASIDTIYKTLDDLQNLSPDFISVTYSAGGSNNSAATVRIASDIQEKYHVPSMAHLACIQLDKNDVTNMLTKFRENGITKILALRGDLAPDMTPKTDFLHASDLVAFIKAHGDFTVAGACYPEGHSECDTLEQDIANLKRKVDAGTDFLVSQLFFNNDYFYSFVDKARNAGIYVPIEAGVMPVTNKKQIERMVTMCGASLPKKFVTIMNRYENNPEALREAGIAYAIDQIVDLFAHGVDGVHLYTMNNAYVATKISQAVEALR